MNPDVPSDSMSSGIGLPSLFEAFPLGITLADGQGRILQVNAESERILGLRREDQQGLTLAETSGRILRPDGSVMPTEEWPSVLAQREERKITGVVMGVHRRDQELVWLDVSACPLPDGNILVTYADISERFRSEAILEARARLVERAPGLDLESLLRATLDEAEHLTNSRIGFYHFVDEDQTNLSLQAWSTHTIQEFCQAEGKGQHYAVRQAGVWADCLREGRPIIHNDYASLPDRKGMPPGHAEVRRELTVPVTRNGRVVAILGVGNKPAPYHDHDVDSVQRLADLAWDLAERKRAEWALQESQQTLEDIIWAIPSGLGIYQFVEPDRLILVKANPQAAHLTGLALEDMLDRELNEVYPGAQASGLASRYLEAVRSGQPFETEDVCYEDHRVVGVYRVRAFPLNGQRLGVAFENITELRRSAKELANAKATLEAAFAGTNIPLVLVSVPDGVLRIVNRAAIEYLGGEDEPDPIGKRLFEIDPTWQDFRADGTPVAFEELPLAKAILKGESTYGLEMMTRRKDGTTRWQLASASPISDAEGRQIAAFIAFPDITEYKQAEAEHQKVREQLQQAQKMESLGSLASGVAHDMNNVLGAILGLAEICREEQAEGSRFFKSMETIITACERGRTMVQSLLGFARKSLAEKRVLDLNALVQDEIPLLERTTLARFSIQTDLAPDLRPLMGDPGALTQSIMNLCVNARDAMEEGGILTLRTRNLDTGEILLEVEDTGCGMSPDVLNRAMDPFFTTKPQGKGTGLGLAMTYGCVKAHGGHVEIQSEPGRGTRVRLRFPTCKSPVEEPLRETKVTDAKHCTSALVMLVDDDVLIQTSIELAIEALGCQCLVADCGEKAIEELAKGTQPDLVILDMNMPGLGGTGTLPRIREYSSDLPVLLATGRADQSAHDLAESYSGVQLLAKPFTLNQLREHLDRLLPNR